MTGPEKLGEVTVLFFAGARDATSTSRASFDLAGRTLGRLVDQLRARYGPDLEAILPSCAVWVNGAPEPSETVLRAGDEVAFLPPVSGG